MKQKQISKWSIAGPINESRIRHDAFTIGTQYGTLYLSGENNTQHHESRTTSLKSADDESKSREREKKRRNEMYGHMRAEL